MSDPTPAPAAAPPNAAPAGAAAFQSIAQSLAIALQDATDNLRNVQAISTTATGAAMAQMLATGNTQQFKPVIDQAQAIMTNAIQNYQNTGQITAQVMQKFLAAMPSPNPPN